MTKEEAVTSSLVLFLALTAATVALCLWAAASALPPADGHGGSHRAWTLLAALLLPPVALATALAGTPRFAQLMPVGAVLPVLVIAGTWSNVTTLRWQSWWVKVLHFPVMVFNATLAGLYALRCVQDLSGIDLGDWGTAITAGHAALQVRIGHASATDNPIWLHLPLLLPICLRYRWYHRIVLLLGSALSVVLLSLLVAAMPAAFHRSQSFRAQPNEQALVLPPSLGVGAKVPWADRLLDDDDRQRWRDHVLDLGVDHVAIEVTAASFDDPLLGMQLQQEIAFARSHGLRIVVLTAPERSFALVPARDLRELSLSMSRVHWLAAEKLQPDLLVLYSGPFGRLAKMTAQIGTIAQWTETIRRSAAEARQGNPDVKLAVAIEGRAPHDEELFRKLRADDSPVDVVGLNVFPGAQRLGELQDGLRLLGRWIERSPGNKEIAIIETGACPQTTGGELGQWQFLTTVIRFAAVNGLRFVCIDALCDRDTAHGLVARDGHLRLAYEELRLSLHLTRSPRPPK